MTTTLDQLVMETGLSKPTLSRALKGEGPVGKQGKSSLYRKGIAIKKIADYLLGRQRQRRHKNAVET